MQDLEELSQAIIALETQRAVLGDRVVDAALAPLHEKLAALEQNMPVTRQRRLVTVMFVDIVNSTLLSQGLEPEEVREIMGGTLKRLSKPVEAYGGQVIQVMGDGFEAVFGLTRAHEDDARQAVRAGLAILAESKACAEELKQRFVIQGFNIRIGINTGRVVAGRIAEAESPVMGLTVVLASRMENAAAPGNLFISQFTYQYLRNAFEVEPLPSINAKGFPKPVETYRVLSARPRTFRTVTRSVDGSETSLIGREVELRKLKSALTHTIKQQESSLVSVIGEAGMGKSRLLYEFDRWVAHAPNRIIAFKAIASSEMAAVPFRLLQDMISYRFGVLTTDPIDITRQKLEVAMVEFLDDEPLMKAQFIGSLLGFDFSASPFLQGVRDDPKQLRERALLYLTQYLSSLARKTPVILMLDDIQWADLPTLTFITHLVQDCPNLPILVVCLARPALIERFPHWGMGEFEHDPSHTTQLPYPRKLQLFLGPLSRQASLELLGEILRNVEALPAIFREQILANADGNPFYLEEFVHALVDARAIRRVEPGGTWVVDPDRLGSYEQPATLVALLEARLDSLTPAQRTLVQQASVIGQVFWPSALQAVRGNKPVTDEELEQLCAHGFFFPQEKPTFAGTKEYRFHHGLLRDVAYQALFKSDRQTYHGQAAAWLIETTQKSGRSGEFASVIAEHYESAGERLLAADWFTQSGTRARKQGVPVQARSFFDRALSLISADENSAPPVSDLRRRWDALAGRDEVLGILAETEARQADDAALVALAVSIGEDALVAEAYYRYGHSMETKGQYSQALDAFEKGLKAARLAQDRRREALILSLKVVCELRLGNHEAAAQTARSALACAEEVADDLVLARNLINVSNFYTEMGDMARAAQLLDRQSTISRRAGNIDDEVGGLSNLGYDYIQLGMPEAAISVLRRCLTMAQTIGHRRFRNYGGLNLALAHIRNGDPPSAMAQLGQCLPELHSMNDLFGYAVGQNYLGLAKELAGQITEALADFEQAATILDKIGTTGYLQDSYAGIARCNLALGDLDAARKHAVSVWDYLQKNAGAGMEFPLLAYETCAGIFTSVGQDALARHIIKAGYGELMIRAGRISVPEWRRSFMEQVPEHRRIQARWQITIEDR